jgi:glycerate kinase
VFTGEGTLDELSVRGKVTTEIAQSAKDRGAQVIALAGVIGKGAEHCYDTGISAFTSISKGPSTLEKAIEESETLIQDGAEKSMRMIMAGLAVAAGR